MSGAFGRGTAGGALRLCTAGCRGSRSASYDASYAGRSAAITHGRPRGLAVASHTPGGRVR